MFRRPVMVVALLAVLLSQRAFAERTVRVFVALCDNASQGIVPVGKRIGDGDKPDENLYWGCADGFGAYFKKSSRWKVEASEEDVNETILRRMRLRHADGGITLTAEAYRGSRIRQCLEDFEAAAARDEHDLVAFIGHNGLMDFSLPAPKGATENDTDVMVLCCKSAAYFRERLEGLGCRNALLTEQFMYPGAFILHDALEAWRAGGSVAEIRVAAGEAYAKNQGISVRAGTGVFTDLD